MKHKLLSILLCLAMALSLLPTAALAEEAGEAAANNGSETHPYTLAELGAMTRTEYIAAQERLGGTMYVTVGEYKYDKNGVLGNGERNDTPGQDPDHSKLNAYGENGYLGEKNDGANGKKIVFVNGSITSNVTGYKSIDNIGTSLLLAVPAYTNVTFKGTEFNNVMSFNYQLYTSPWSQLGELKFDDCTFNGIIVGAIAAQTLTFNSCEFKNYTNTYPNTGANSSNPTWIRPAYGNWTKGDNEVQGSDFRSLTEINFTNNKVTSTRPVKFERIAQWEMPTTVTATGNTFDISAQDNDTETKNVGMYFGANAKFDLVAENNKKEGTTAALYTAVYSAPNDMKYAGLPAGSTVKDSKGNEIELTDALKWKGDPSKSDDVLTLKTTYADTAVAGINGVSYNSLADAIAAAKNGDTIKLLKDVTNGDGVIVPSGKNFTLDFDNHTYTVTQKLAGSKGTESQCFQLLKDSTLTFKNGTIKANNEKVAMIIQNYSNLTLENMLLDGESITRKDAIIYTMSNNCGNVEIKDTKINTVSNGVAFDVYGGFGDYSDVTVTVTGNSEINGKVEVARGSGTQNKNTLAINGGTINGELKIDSSIKSGDATAITKTENVLLDAPNGYKWTKVGNTGVLVKEDSAAVVNGVGYATLAAAINAAGNDDTVTLLKDVTENVTIPAGKTITLDLNGKTINGGTGTSSAAITNYGTVTITDSSTEKAGTIKRSDIGTEGETSYYVIRNLGKMTITAANVINNSGYAKTNPSGSMVGSSLICNGDDDSYQAELTINGGTFKQDNFIAIKNGSSAKLTVTGGQISSNHSAIQNWCEATINGGEINGQMWTDSWDEKSTGKTVIDGDARISGEIVMDITGSIKPTLEVKNGTVNVTWRVTTAASNAGAKPNISGGNFSTDLKNTGYLADSVGAEVKSADGSTYSYYTSMDDALAAAKPGDTVTDLKAATEQKVTLTLKYNDGATADTTYNVAGGTTITLPTPKRSGYTFNGWYDGSKFYAAGASYKVSATVTLNASWSYISSGSSSYDPTYSVSTPSKTENGSVTVSPKNASKGDTVTVTVKPDSGYVLETLTVTDKNGNELTLKDKGNGKYTFVMPAGKVEVKASFAKEVETSPFADVAIDAYYYEAVKWAVKNGITTGVGNDLFAPGQPCTRAQIVTFLWRAAGSPEPKGTAAGMTDVVSGSYYEKAVAWAIENGVTTGTTATTFSPDATCTRAQAVTFLARALNAKASGKAEFSDVPTDSYFAEAVAWAAANGVTEGIGGGLFAPDNNCTRGQIVTFLYRAYNK